MGNVYDNKDRISDIDEFNKGVLVPFFVFKAKKQQKSNTTTERIDKTIDNKDKR